MKCNSWSWDRYSSDANQRLHEKLAKKGIIGENDTILWIPVKPDWHNPDKKVTVFLDGPPHKQPKQREFDEALTIVLRHLRYKVMREPYEGRISEEKLDEVAEFAENESK